MSTSILSQDSVVQADVAPVVTSISVPGLDELHVQLLQASLAAHGSMEIPVGHLHERSPKAVTITTIEDILALTGKQQEIVVGHVRRSCLHMLQ